MINIEKFEKVLAKAPHRFVIITFNGGFGGSILTRIIMSHKDFYFEQSDLLQNEYNDPIRYPDQTEGFFIHSSHFLGFKEQHLSCVHLDFYNHFDYTEIDPQSLSKYIKILKTSDKKIVLKTHDLDLHENKILKNVKFIRVIGNQLDRKLPTVTQKPVLPIPADNIFNLPINDLLSYDYEIFLKCYLQLVNWLNTTPRINSVRSFILLWLEKQERYKNG
jgi:hypothetical protein